MKFHDIPYTRPNLAAIKNDLGALLKEFAAAENTSEQATIVSKINDIRNTFDTMWNVASIKYTLDTTNKSYEEENTFFDNNSPAFKGYIDEFYKAILGSRFRNELEQEFGKQLFSIAEMSIKTFSPAVLEDLKKENQLCSEYTKLLASASIPYDDKALNLSEIGPYLNSENREERIAANEGMYKFFSDNASAFDSIFDQLVKLRTGIARKLGYKNFVELGYYRMLRGDYNAAMVAGYRSQVKGHIVPIATKLRKRQAKRLGLDKLLYYDEDLFFLTGNANPKGDAEWIVDNAKKMYDELSPETKEFFNFMIDNEMMDLESRKGKATGGYCTYISDYKSPFIFSNFNGTTHDIIVLTHEAGHAFQVFESRKFDVPEYHFPTYEACEIHSMSMEFVTWPWMDLFFKEDTEKFKYSHISKAVQFIPYGVAVDEFQHWIYENPDAAPAERNAAWRLLEKKYLPHRDYAGNKFLEKGGFWQKQRHIYNMPFYYIDYTLAQTCAFQFWKKSNENSKKALEDYIRLCRAGGSKSFLELVELADLTSPFRGGCLESVAGEISSWLESVDDSKL
jgi:M3 family oligoendopeptidase